MPTCCFGADPARRASARTRPELDGLRPPGNAAALRPVRRVSPAAPVGGRGTVATVGTRLIESIAAVLRAYGVGETEMVHAIRTIRCTLHGFAALRASDGFQWSGDPDETFGWMIRFIDQGLRAIPAPAGG
jgi:Tetracyclin repressor-like, C-terminal domain